MSNHQGNITVLDLYSPNNRTSNFIKQKKIKNRKEEIKSTITVILWDFNVFSSVIDRTSRKLPIIFLKESNSTNNEFDQTDIYKTLYSIGEYMLFSRAHKKLIRKDHILGHKINLKKIKWLLLYNVCSLTITELT